MHWKDQYMSNPMNKEALIVIQNELNYNSIKIGMSSGNLANFANLRGVTWRGIHFSRLFLRLSLCSLGLY